MGIVIVIIFSVHYVLLPVLLIVLNTTIMMVMIPIKDTQLVAVNSSHQVVLNTIKKCSFTRIPVYKSDHNNIIGFINVYDVLCSKKEITNLYDFVKPIKTISQDTLVTDAMEAMQMEKEKIALVVRVARKNCEIPVGIITMKDLVEELFGELSSW